jgi:hypothetical protein
MTERPIIFSAPMVRAILDGRKTQTRRVAKPQPPDPADIWARAGIDYGWFTDDVTPGVFRVAGPVWAVRETGYPTQIRCPYGQPGDRLWVRETFCELSVPDPDTGEVEVAYRADDGWIHNEPDSKEMLPGGRWRPSIHMPRWASRIDLEVTGVRVERVQDISGADVFAEGVDNGKSNPKMGKRWENMQRMAFQDLWDSINKKRGFGWDTNPWVWVVEFRRVEP